MNKKDILNSLTLKDKAKLFVGKNFWELEPINGKSLFLSDGPHGVRKENFDENHKPHTVEAICYPAACLSACSFNKELFQIYGRELGKECIKHDVDVLLGPGINIKRNPLCGRNFEYFSEDPVLAGELAANYITGVQSKHVGCCLKHYALNSQEQARFVNNSIVDERTMREIYLKGFEIAIKKSQPYCIMGSYNLVNGIHATENKFLLTDIARKEFGFKGIFMTDWGALSNPIESLKAGLDLEMPGVSKGSDLAIYNAINDGKLDESLLTASSKRLVDLYAKSMQSKVNDFKLDHALAVAKKINDESIVLLKNENNILPLKKTAKIALIGDLAKNPRIQGGGSSQINAINVTNLFDEFTNDGIKFEYAKGYDREAVLPNEELIVEAVNIASMADVVVLMMGLPRIIESEGYDRENLNLPEAQLELINRVSITNKNIVVVLQNGSAIEMPFIDDAKGLLECYLGGSMHAKSIKDILFGDVNPSGRLAETFPLTYNRVPSKDYYLENPYYSLYKESIYVGYRYYDTFNKSVLFPFGYGLSYSKVEYNKFKVKIKADTALISFSVTNESLIPCKEVIQIYVGQTDNAIFKAKKELKLFEKVALASRETKKIRLELNINELRYFSNKEKKWVLESGNYRFYLSKNALDESIYEDVAIIGDANKEDLREVLPIYYNLDRTVENSEFETLLGHEVDLTHHRKPYSIESPIKDIMKNPLGNIIFKKAKKKLTKDLNEYDKKMYELSIPYQPIRSLQMVATLSKSFIEGIVDVFNGHAIKGIKKMKSDKKL